MNMSYATFTRVLFGRKVESWQDAVTTIVRYGTLAYVVRTYGVGATFVSFQPQCGPSDSVSLAVCPALDCQSLLRHWVLAVCWAEHDSDFQLLRGYRLVRVLLGLCKPDSEGLTLSRILY